MVEGKECVQTLSIDHRTEVNQGLQAHSPETEEQSSLSLTVYFHWSGFGQIWSIGKHVSLEVLKKQKAKTVLNIKSGQ